jgi:hypothetical protein
MNRSDVRMLHACKCSRLAFKVFAQFETTCKVRRQHLDRNSSVEPRASGAVHLIHAARTNLRDDFVGAEFCARGDRHKVPSNHEWREYTTARPFSGKITGDVAKSRKVL